MATADGTWTYRDRFGDRFGRTYFRRFGSGVTSSVGLGTYLGDPTDAIDDAYRETAALAVGSGMNHLDTASNYRCGRSERVVGDVLRTVDVPREQLFVASKAGFLPFDESPPADPAAYVRDRFVDGGPVDPDELAHGRHCLAPAYLDWTLDRSLDRLGVETIDTYYLHNPETQLAVRDRDAVYDRIEAAFELFERRRAVGEVGSYGVATWTALRVPPDHAEFLDLAELVSRARRAADSIHGSGDADSGSPDHGFRVVQLPFNVRMADAFTVPAHGEDRQTALAFAQEAGLEVVASAVLGQGELTDAAAIPDGVDRALAGDTPAQRAINFARSAPAVRTALVGTTDPEHLRENLAAGTFDPMGAERFDQIFE